MQVLFLLIGCSLFIALGFLALFIWAVRTGQFEDKYTPSVRMLFDHSPQKPKNVDTGENQPSKRKKK